MCVYLQEFGKCISIFVDSSLKVCMINGIFWRFRVKVRVRVRASVCGMLCVESSRRPDHV